MLIIGDVHGKLDEYNKIIKNYDGKTIQVGDFGFKEEHDWFRKNTDRNKHTICFGNHDYHPYNDVNKRSTGKFGRYNKEIITISGAFSIDSGRRTEGIDWFRDEELNYSEMQKAIDLVIKFKPKVIISHDCPQEAREQLFGIFDRSITTMGMQTMLDAYEPEKWIFGHYHRSKNEMIGNTQFICLNELETYELNESI